MAEENAWTDPRLGIGQGGVEGRTQGRLKGTGGFSPVCASSRWVLPELEEKL